MDYNMGFALSFKCFFFNDYISIFYIQTQYMIHDGKKKWIEKKITKILTNKYYELLND